MFKATAAEASAFVNPGPSRTGIYLECGADEGALARLQAALSAAPIQAVLFRQGAGGRSSPGQLAPLIELVQSRNAAALIEDDARLARTLKADGVHLTWGPDIEERYADARTLLGGRFIVGAMPGTSKHDAMALAEAGADYIGFGRTEPLDEQYAMVDWWAEIFEVPCVAFGAAGPDEAAILAGLSADFIGILLPPGETADAAGTRIRLAQEAIRAAVRDAAPASEGQR